MRFFYLNSNHVLGFPSLARSASSTTEPPPRYVLQGAPKRLNGTMKTRIKCTGNKQFRFQISVCLSFCLEVIIHGPHKDKQA